MGVSGYWILAAICLCAAASFFFALAETALFSLGNMRVQRLSSGTSTGGREIARMLERPVDLLGAIVLGNTLANAGVVAFAVILILDYQWPLGWTLAGFLAGVLFGCEALPKTLAVRDPERWALLVVRSVSMFERICHPFQSIFQNANRSLLKRLIPASIKPQNKLTDEDYGELLEMACQQGALPQREKEIIFAIISLDRKTVRDIMRPRANMAAIADNLSVEEMIVAARKLNRRRLPLYEETPDAIVGILDTPKLLLNPKDDVGEAIELAAFVPESMNLLKLLQNLQRQKRGLAVVLDEFGSTAGIVRTEDILSEVVGPIRDEVDTGGFVMERLGPGKWRLSGLMRIDDFRREHPEMPEVEDVDTMGGLALRLAEVVPATGQVLRFHGLKLTVHAADERRVRELLVEEARRT
ncbi:MAG: HlyC/CorC family transporter [Verrucomicrobia bacterium]|nr:HlyC/CorC family transporter [Verrucomicrobiota bacterium]